MFNIRIAMAQVNPTVGSLAANAEKTLEWTEKAKRAWADVVVFPELMITGYPPEDLVLKPGFVADNIACLNALSKKIRGITAIVGFVDRKDAIPRFKHAGACFNAAALIHDGGIKDVYHKMRLPNYGVFDEERYFRPGSSALNFTLGGVTFGVGICEDIWFPDGPVRAQAAAGADVIVNLNASPYHAGKLAVREKMLRQRARDNSVVIAYNNMVGGQDELVFDGQGMVIDSSGKVIARGAPFDEDLIVVDLKILRKKPRKITEGAEPPQGVRDITLSPIRTAKKRALRITAQKPSDGVKPLSENDEMLEALMLGTCDYVKKNGFRHAVVGLSGGIDSSLVAAIAADALGGGNVTGVFMPSVYTSKESLEDAKALAKNLGIEFLTIPIRGVHESYISTLKTALGGSRPGTAEENIQARIRGNILMALSNKFGWLVLTTGNKSEMSVGYATLYGDMAGGFAVIKDVPKTVVYELSSRLNKRAGRRVIPRRVFTKAPTAELKYNQTDQDTLPPYDVLDAILKAYVEEDKSAGEIAALGFPLKTVRKVVRMVDISEYKRRQAPPGIKITPRALGKDRRMPITNGYGK
ncbi:MAG: NAD+ synthase [Deltaproteobacteria bacterium]|nr:NAD+ synthase [Deltaproteobacteria bacterium]